MARYKEAVSPKLPSKALGDSMKCIHTLDFGSYLGELQGEAVFISHRRSSKAHKTNQQALRSPFQYPRQHAATDSCRFRLFSSRKPGTVEREDFRREDKMTIYSVYIINKAGSLIYHFDSPNTSRPAVEKTFSYPLELVLKVFDEKVVVAFGERDGIKGFFVNLLL